MLRLIILILMLVTASSIAGAQKSAVEILQEKPNDSWKTGVWDEKRMRDFSGNDLTFIGDKYLHGDDVEPNRRLAEKLFAAGVKKEPELASLVGSFYLKRPAEIQKALLWYVNMLYS